MKKKHKQTWNEFYTNILGENYTNPKQCPFCGHKIKVDYVEMDDSIQIDKNLRFADDPLDHKRVFFICEHCGATVYFNLLLHLLSPIAAFTSWGQRIETSKNKEVK